MEITKGHLSHLDVDVDRHWPFCFSFEPIEAVDRLIARQSAYNREAGSVAAAPRHVSVKPFIESAS